MCILLVTGHFGVEIIPEFSGFPLKLGKGIFSKAPYYSLFSVSLKMQNLMNRRNIYIFQEGKRKGGTSDTKTVVL